jgi:hypothetical protein
LVADEQSKVRAEVVIPLSSNGLSS